jgi:hypothetical protein
VRDEIHALQDKVLLTDWQLGLVEENREVVVGDKQLRERYY